MQSLSFLACLIFMAGGKPQTALNDPNSAVLTQATAEKYFGNWKSALGKTIKYENKDLYTSNRILKNLPHNTDFPLGVVVPYSALRKYLYKE